MPTMPKPGDGAIVGSFGQQISMATLFLAPWVPASLAPPPAGPLALYSSDASMNHPGAPWIRQGLMRDDNIDVNETDPTKLEYRRGFRRVYQGEIVRQAGVRSFVCQMDEVDNAVLALLTGESTTALGSPGDNWLELGPGEQYNRSVLLVCFEALTGMETHYYSPHGIVSYKFAKNAEFMELAINIGLIPFINANNDSKDIKRYEFPVGT